MKRIYQRPEIKIQKIGNSAMLCSSGVTVDGNTGIQIDDGDPSATASSKQYSSTIFDDESDI